MGLYLLDVSGHGVGAALLSFTLNHVLSPAVEGALLTGAVAGRRPWCRRRAWPSA